MPCQENKPENSLKSTELRVMYSNKNYIYTKRSLHQLIDSVLTINNVYT